MPDRPTPQRPLAIAIAKFVASGLSARGQLRRVVVVRIMTMARGARMEAVVMTMARGARMEAVVMTMARGARMEAHRFSVVVGERCAGRGQGQRGHGHESDDHMPQATSPRLSALTVRSLCWCLRHDNGCLRF